MSKTRFWIQITPGANSNDLEFAKLTLRNLAGGSIRFLSDDQKLSNKYTILTEMDTGDFVRVFGDPPGIPLRLQSLVSRIELEIEHKASK